MTRVTSIGAIGILISLAMVSAIPLAPADHTSSGPAETADMWVNEKGDHMTGSLGLGDENITFENGDLSGSLGSEGLWFDGRRVCVANLNQSGCGDTQETDGPIRYHSIPPTAIAPYKDNPNELCYKRDAIAYQGHADNEGHCQLHYAPVTLPDGATVKKVEVHVFDADSGNHLEAKLLEHPTGTTTTNAIAQDATSDPGTPGHTTLVMDDLDYGVDNRNNSLSLRFYVSKMNEGCTDISCLYIQDTIVGYVE